MVRIGLLRSITDFIIFLFILLIRITEGYYLVGGELGARGIVKLLYIMRKR